MGASLSNLTENGSGNGRPGLGDIPESCVACVFLYLSPPEICNLARLNRAFRGAASSDAVWETKLPPNYHNLLDLLSNPDVYQNLCKKDIFALLSRPLPFEDGNKARFQCGMGGQIYWESLHVDISQGNGNNRHRGQEILELGSNRRI
ncbi:hypothetical protein DH2020_039941 [Rehmannia glutinosa]|uniref:F-box domain-containing protein n=1 Tax=Rehmannia glutinosa TaxID=99300 RepID=A0ABR0UWC0_REHGL